MLSVDVGHLRGLLKQLDKYNDMISDHDLVKYNAAQTVANLKTDLQQVEWSYKFDVESETVDGKPDSKKKFGNQSLRDAEFSRRMSIDEGVLSLRTQIADAERTKHEADSHLYKLMEDRKRTKLEINVETAILNALADPATRSMLNEQATISRYDA